MSLEPTDRVAAPVRRVVAALTRAQPPDGELLARFLGRREEAAFAELVRRHGPMVLGVCRRVLGNRHDAEDAFQAVFLVLVRRGAELADRPTVGGWLHGVAHRTALKARTASRRRRVHESAAVPDPDPPPAPDWLPVLEEELHRLPPKYRDPLVLCELDELPRRDAASRLGIPEGTLSSRLAAAKTMLADRLRRRGVVAAVALGVLIAHDAAAQVPPALAESAARLAASAPGAVPPAIHTLLPGATRTMTLLKCAAAALGVALAVAAGVAAVRTPQPAAPVAATPGDPPKPAEPPREPAPGNGVYELRFENDGKATPVQLADGYPGWLGERLSASIGEAARLESRSNDNVEFNFFVNRLGPLPAKAADIQTALVVDGVILHLSRPEKVPADGVVNARANVYSPEVARVLAARYKIEPMLRTHPGHRFHVRWVPAKRGFKPGEPITLTLHLTNTGSGPLRFTFGGQQRGPRDNQFRFLAQRNGVGLPDTGDATNHGGIVQSKTLKPGETFTAEVDISKWFTFTQPDTYRITGVFEMPVIDPNSADGWGPEVWDDLAVGECVVRIAATK